MANSHSQEARVIYTRLLRYSLPHWKAFALSVVAMLVYAGTNTGFAALMKPMIDGSFVAKDPAVIRLVPMLIIGLLHELGWARSDPGIASRHVRQIAVPADALLR